MLIKPPYFLLLCLCLTSSAMAANQTVESEEKSNARAYRAHLMSFIWPSKLSSELINYQNIYELDDIQRFDKEEAARQSTSVLALDNLQADEELNPFIQYQAQLGKKVEILSNQTWPMIFEDQGSISFADFHSQKLLDGYPELSGQIQVKLGRYLETSIEYKHYLFDSFTAPIIEEKNINNLIFDELDPFEEEIKEEVKTVKLYEPGLVLNVNIERKTASKKLNYLDHPIIGSLLYFEPISVDVAEHELMLQALTEEEIVRDAEASISTEEDELLPVQAPILFNQP